MANARQLTVGILMYAAEHKGALPAKFDDMKPYFGADENAMRNILTSPANNRYPGYVYAKPKADRLAELKDPGQTIVVYEAYEAWPAGGVVAAFADGHTEVIPTEEQLKAKLPK
jgi:hypothetical protein